MLPPEIERQLLEARFQYRKRQWKRETMFMSNMNTMMNNRHYQAIIAEGPKMIPIILADLQREPDWWFYALWKITGVDLATDDNSGRLDRLTTAYLQWGRDNGLLVDDTEASPQSPPS